MLQEITGSQIQAVWPSDPSEPEEVKLTLPYGCSYGGIWYKNRQTLSRNYLSVPGNLRRAGIATRLVSALTHIALTAGDFDYYVGGVSSTHTLSIIEKMFPERVSYRPSVDPNDPARMSVAEAFEYVAQQQIVIADIALDGLNPSDFEQPANWQAPWLSSPVL